MSNENTKHTLFTNIELIKIQEPATPMMLFGHAVLISEGQTFLGPETYDELRIFGTEANDEHCKLLLPPGALPYTLTPVYSPHNTFIGADNKPSPLWQGSMLAFGHGLKMFLDHSVSGQDLDIFTHQGKDINVVWKALLDKTAAYWTMPAMPHKVYARPSDAGLFWRP